MPHICNALYSLFPVSQSATLSSLFIHSTLGDDGSEAAILCHRPPTNTDHSHTPLSYKAMGVKCLG